MSAYSLSVMIYGEQGQPSRAIWLMQGRHLVGPALCGVMTLPAFGRNGLVAVPPFRREAGRTKTKTLSAGVCSLDGPATTGGSQASQWSLTVANRQGTRLRSCPTGGTANAQVGCRRTGQITDVGADGTGGHVSPPMPGMRPVASLFRSPIILETTTAANPAASRSRRNRFTMLTTLPRVRADFPTDRARTETAPATKPAPNDRP